MRTPPNVTHAAVLLAALLALTPASPARAQDLVTDRPDQTESSVTVPAGHWQLEAGWTFTHDEEDGLQVESHEAPGTLLRVGIAERWELRFGWSGWVHEDVQSGSLRQESEGVGDAEVGAKVYLREQRGGSPEIALLFSTSVPLGDGDLTSDEFDPAFRFSLSHTFNERLSLGYNLGVNWATSGGADSSTLSRGIYTVALGLAIDDRTGAFVELFGDVALSDRGSPSHSIDGGFTFLLTETLQLDLAGGLGLSDVAPDWFVGAGVSFRLPN